MVLNELFKKYQKFYLILVLFFILNSIYSCTEDSNPVINNNYDSKGKSALVIIVENNDGLLYDANMEIAFQFYKSPMLDIFSELFGIDKSVMNNMSLNQIVETYGEPWQINQIKNNAESHYDTIVTLRNELATENNMKNYLEKFSKSNYTIDMVFCLHGSSKVVEFANYQTSLINDLAYYLKSQNIRLRMLYQTCCYAGQALQTWNQSGILAVNGAAGLNSITLFSPGYFMEEWVKGATFEDAVNKAYQRDIAKIGSYNNKIPVLDYILTTQNLNASIQMVTGKDTKITFKNYLKTVIL